ncbi:MAG: lipid-A-disaccharide synthase-related protein, partial [Cyanobacteriota bacterium]
MRVLCLSNGHGEDIIAVRILQQLQQQSHSLELAALPLVGDGRAYAELDIPIIGPVQTMPSGGFIYMDGRQLARDVQGGLLQLTLAQHRAIRKWASPGRPKERGRGVILAVGDIVPLLFAWLSGVPYAFVGTAKSEYYLRDEAGPLPRRDQRGRWEGWSGSVYLPWERWLMSRRRCKAVFPRDGLTTQMLQKWSIPAFDLGNPMMDGLAPPRPRAIFYSSNAEQEEMRRSLMVALLPGSRPPEAYANWQQIMQACVG